MLPIFYFVWIIGISLADVYQLIILSGAIMIGLLDLLPVPWHLIHMIRLALKHKGLKTNLLSIYFLILLAVSVSIAAQIVGSLRCWNVE